jgi:hypothetical protein
MGKSVEVDEVDMNEYKKRLLFLTIEDVPMLVHAWWEAITQAQALSDSLSMAEKAIKDLLDQGCVRLYRLTISDMSRPEWSEIPEVEIEELESPWVSWRL